MRTVLSRAERQNHKLNGVILEFRWSTSRNPKTYGYNVLTLRMNGEKIASCNGGGYNMTVTCLGEFIAKKFPEELKKLKPKESRGLSFYKPSEKGYRSLKKYAPGVRIAIDEACVKNSMIIVLNKIGFNFVPVYEYRNVSCYVLKAI